MLRRLEDIQYDFTTEPQYRELMKATRLAKKIRGRRDRAFPPHASGSGDDGRQREEMTGIIDAEHGAENGKDAEGNDEFREGSEVTDGHEESLGEGTHDDEKSDPCFPGNSGMTLSPTLLV